MINLLCQDLPFIRPFDYNITMYFFNGLVVLMCANVIYFPYIMMRSSPSCVEYMMIERRRTYGIQIP